MPRLNVSEDQILELAKQLSPESRRALAVTLLREAANAPDLSDLRQLAKPELAAVLKDRDLDMSNMSPGEVDEAIRQICEES